MFKARCVFTNQVCVHKPGRCSQVRYDTLFTIGCNVDKSGMYVLFAVRLLLLLCTQSYTV